MRFASIVGACTALSCAVPASAAIFSLTSDGQVTSTQFSGARASTLDLVYDDVAGTLSFSFSGIYSAEFTSAFSTMAIDYFEDSAGGHATAGDIYYGYSFVRDVMAAWTNVADGDPIVSASARVHYERNQFPDEIYYFRSNAQPAPNPSVPEPATWAMLIVGFGLVGVASRRQRAGYAGSIVRDMGTSSVLPALSEIRSTQE